MNAKSLLGVLSLGIVGGTTIRIMLTALMSRLPWTADQAGGVRLCRVSLYHKQQKAAGAPCRFLVRFFTGSKGLSIAGRPIPQIRRKVLHD